MNQAQRLSGKDIARDDEEDGHSNVAARKEYAKSREGDKVMLAPPTKGVSQFGPTRYLAMSPFLMMQAKDEQRCKASEAIQIGCPTQRLLRSSSCVAGSKET